MQDQELEKLHTLIGSLSVSGGSSIELAAFITAADFEATFPLDGFVPGELALFTRGFREAVFLAGAGTGTEVAVLETPRVVRPGAGGSAA